ncbi:restriction endonuclease subunit S [Vibrio vulnificus]|nr:restriction endonuclease subunit S [Vibrio vulnificus]
MDRKPALSFNNEIFWKQYKLGSLITKIETGTNELGKEIKTDFPLLKMGNIQLGTFNILKLEYLTEKQFNRSKKSIAKNGDFLFNTRNTLALVGKAATWTIENKDFVFNSNIARISFDDSKISSHFLNYLYTTSSIWSQVKARAVGTTSVAAVYPRDLSSIKLFIPNLKEQEKISTFFRQLDSKINLQQEKIDLLKEQKKGYMQKVFSQELRFKDENGKDYPEWTSDLLQNLGTFGTSYPFSRAIEGKGEYCYIHYGDIHSNLPTVCENILFPSITEKRYFEVINENDILFADASEDYADLGKAILVKTVESQNLIAGLHTHKLTVNKRINPLYFIYFTQTNSYREFIKKMGTGVSVLGISKSNLNKLEVPLPSMEEQKKISELFYLLDKKITSETKKIQEIKLQKQALIQQMFI